MAPYRKLICFIPLLATHLCVGQNASCRPPVIKLGPPPYGLYINDSTIPLTCQPEGSQPLTIRWFWNGNPLECNKYGVQCLLDGTPTQISPVNLDNEGYYQCFVDNPCGSTMSSTSRVQVMRYSPPSNVLRSVQFSVNTPFSLPCDVGPSVPSLADRVLSGSDVPIVEWYTARDRDDSVWLGMDLSYRTQINPVNGELQFPTPELSDARLYKCALQYPIGEEIGETYGAKSEVTLLEDSHEFAPALLFSAIVPPIGLEGQSVDLHCLFSGRPMPSMQASSWSKFESSLPQSRFRFDNSFTKMTITNLQPSDKGSYGCSPAGFSAVLVHRLELTVEAVPVFKSATDGPRNINATEGDTVTIPCKVHATPTAKIQWFRNAELLNPFLLPERYELSKDEKELTITNVCKRSASCGGVSDVMALQCNASNDHGYAFQQGYLNVLQRTTITSEPISIPVPNPQLVTFPCVASTDPTTPLSRTWYYNENALTEVDTFIYVDADGSLNIDMREDTDGGYERCGSYRCYVTNGYTEYAITSMLTCDPPPAKSSMWWILLVVVAGLLIVLLLLLCAFFYCFRQSHDKWFCMSCTCYIKSDQLV